jgi:hypothetical protein
MTDEQNDKALMAAEELDSLKDRANQLGVDFHPSIGYEKLSGKVKDFLAAKEAEKPDKPDEPALIAPAPLSGNEKLVRMKRDMNALVRIRVSCMNANKREWEGEFFSVGNRVTGQMMKYVPYDQIFHVPQMILTMIQERQCQVFHTVKDHRGNKSRKGKLIKEFGIEILPQLTTNELKELAQRQAMANGTSDVL